MRTLNSFILLIYLIATPVAAANPFWLEGKTDQRYSITVYRSATCGCCKGWIDHLEQHNFDVKDVTVDDVDEFKRQFDVPPKAASCHTAIVNGVAIEGHVPAQDIKRMLGDPGDIRLLTVPAMPSGTPGMDSPGAPSQAFRVFSIDRNNNVGVFNSYQDY